MLGRGHGKKELKWIHRSLKNAKVVTFNCHYNFIKHYQGETVGQLRDQELTSKEGIFPDESFESLLERVAKELNIKVYLHYCEIFSCTSSR